MARFLQFHLLTSYGPSNPNRDDQGRPKQAVVGSVPRLRMSSQSIKRALRESTYFESQLRGNLGTRTKRLHEKLMGLLTSEGHPAQDAKDAADTVAVVFGKLEKTGKGEDAKTHATTLAFISPEEWALAEDLARKAIAKEALPKDKDLKKMVLRHADGAVDIAMFGRMLADDPDFNRNAAVQVAHAITTHAALVEDDWFSAVDDLNKADDTTGAGHLGETGFGSGVYYQYVCVNLALLVDNLGGDHALAARGVETLARALPMVTPGGKQNSFAHHPRAFYVLAETGDQAPRDLSGAFFEPVRQTPYPAKSVEVLEKTRADMDKAYGPCWTEQAKMHVGHDGTLDDIVSFAGRTVQALVQE
ncbi:MAG: type I-E CRISPR-associated protein Cas7/Cse4/CasC [Paracoccaceae bacterium]